MSIRYSQGAHVFRTVVRGDVTATRETWDTPCPQCGDSEVEERVYAQEGRAVTSCLTCGHVRRRRALSNAEHPHDTRGGQVRNTERDEEIRDRFRAGEPRADLARAYGLSDTRVYQICGVQMKRARKWSEGDVLNALITYRVEHGRWPSWHGWSATRERPSAHVVASRFHTWGAALDAAKRRYAGEEI